MGAAKHVHWVIYAYNRVNDAGDFVESTQVDVVARSASDAEARARVLVPGKNFYYLSRVVEHLPGACGSP